MKNPTKQITFISLYFNVPIIRYNYEFTDLAYGYAICIIFELYIPKYCCYYTS